MRVLVFEPKFVGHFIGFALAACRAFVEVGCEVTLALSRDARGSEAASVKLRDVPKGVQIDYTLEVPKVYRKWTNARLESSALEQSLATRGPDWIVAPRADFLAPGLLLNRRLRQRVARLAAPPQPARPATWL